MGRYVEGEIKSAGFKVRELERKLGEYTSYIKAAYSENERGPMIQRLNSIVEPFRSIEINENNFEEVKNAVESAVIALQKSTPEEVKNTMFRDLVASRTNSNPGPTRFQ